MKTPNNFEEKLEELLKSYRQRYTISRDIEAMAMAEAEAEENAMFEAEQQYITNI